MAEGTGDPVDRPDSSPIALRSASRGPVLMNTLETTTKRSSPEIDPSEPIFSISQDFLEVIKLHFTDTSEHYSQILQTIEGLTGGR